MSRFYVKFEFNDRTLSKKTDQSIMDLRQGFWINNVEEITKLTDGIYWIPPARILHVEELFYKAKEVIDDTPIQKSENKFEK